MSTWSWILRSGVDRSTLPAPSRAAGARARQLDRERRAVPELAVHPDRPAHRLDHLPGDPEPQAEAAVVPRRHGPLEALEDPLLILRSQADPVVAERSSCLGSAGGAAGLGTEATDVTVDTGAGGGGAAGGFGAAPP
jgi:hypothetical protein